jgi:hypothetical protein
MEGRRDFLKTVVLGTLAQPGLAGPGPDNQVQHKKCTLDTPLRDYGVSHGGIRPVRHPRLGVEINGQTCVRYLRFLRPARLDRLELTLVPGSPGGGSGRWVPNVPTHPAHLLISVLDKASGQWRVVKEVDLPANPVIGGQGLSQDMSTDEMSAILEQARKTVRHIITLEGLHTNHVRVECDREHPVWPNHGECNGGPFNVPFAALNPLQAFGEPESDESIWPVPPRVLTTGTIAPQAPTGMSVEVLPDMLLFRGDRLSAGFSLRRPMLMHLGWDAFGRRLAGANRVARSVLVNRSLSHDAGGPSTTPAGLSGPLARTLAAECGAHLWTGEVAVEGNQVLYRNLRCAVEGLSLDAVFTVKADRIILDLTQRCARDLPVLEFAAWQLAWDLGEAITGAMALPTLLPGRNGDVSLPLHWVGSGPGSLACRVLEGKNVRMQVESYRCRNIVTGGLYLGKHAGLEETQIVPAGAHQASIEFSPTALEAATPEGAPGPGPGVATRWSTIFACFRPELTGFADHSASCTCHTNQADAIEVVCLTRKPADGPNPLDLVRFTIGRALLDGPGYGYWRNLYLDPDPHIVMSAGRIHQVDPDPRWLREVEPGLVETVRRMLSTLDKDGLVCSHDLSGNRGSHRWSTNCFDVIGFGHHDAYVNALAYRGFRNATALLTELGQRDLADRCREAATGIRGAYAPTFLNSAKGWLGSWRSRDGQLHDYASPLINGMAAALGLLDPETARTVLLKLEQLRHELGVGSAKLGLPLNLLPIHPGDHMAPLWVGEVTPTFETYCDGSLSGWANYYLRALSCAGLKEQAQRLARDLDEAYASGVFDGGNFTGTEFHSWEGMPNGYEGTMGCVFGSLYAIAVEQGVLTPPKPEWWPAGG